MHCLRQYAWICNSDGFSHVSSARTGGEEECNGISSHAKHVSANSRIFKHVCSITQENCISLSFDFWNLQMIQ